MVTSCKYHSISEYVTLHLCRYSVGVTCLFIHMCSHCSHLSDCDILLRHTGERHTERVELLNPVNLALECTWTGNKNKLPNVTGLWRKDGDEIENSRLAVQLENKQYQLKRVYVTSCVQYSNLHCITLFVVV